MKQEVAKARGRRGASQSPAIERTRTRPVFTPRADIYETEAAVTILTEMPGVKSDDIDIMLEGGVLTIRGRAQEAAHEGYRQVSRMCLAQVILTQIQMLIRLAS